MLAAEYDWNAPVEFHVVVDLEANPPSLDVWGELDLASVSAFRDALNQAIEAGAQQLIVDFTHVTFLGSTGIRELIRARRHIRVEVRASTPIVRRALASASLMDSFVIIE